MNKVAVVTDSNSGITQKEAEELGVYVLPMPFYIDDEVFYEDITLSQKQFFEKLESDADVKTSMPAVGEILDMWDKLLKEYEEIVHIPMSSGLSGSCATSTMLSGDYDGRIAVVNNQRISVTQKLSVLDAKRLADEGKTAEEIKDILEGSKFESSIYIMVDTLKYLKKGGRVTPAAAALGTLLKIKPVLQIQGEKLDAFAKARTVKQAKNIIIEAVKRDCIERFGAKDDLSDIHLALAYSGEPTEGNVFFEEVKAMFPDHEIFMDPLSLSVSCHIGPGAIAMTCTKKLNI